MRRNGTMAIFKCNVCGYLYDEAGNDKLLGMINYLLKKPDEDRTNAKTGEDNKTDNQTM